VPLAKAFFGAGGVMARRILSLVEVAMFYSLVLFVIWGGRGQRPAAVIIVLVLVGISVGSNFLHGDSWERVGLSTKNFLPNLKLTGLVCGPIVLLFWAYVWRHRYDGYWDSAFVFAGYPIWAFVQEYVLLGFVGNRIEDGIEKISLVPWINGFLFGMAHLPNPVLMTVTFFSGVLFTTLFLKRRHLVPLSVVHALVGIGINMAFGQINGIMSVGPGYYARVGTLPY
jgi:hypothetical protein